MGKKKKAPEKLLQYFKGAATAPTRVANEQEMATIAAALEECLPNKTHAFSYSKLPPFKFVVGLKAGLRSLKQQRTKFIIYDDTAPLKVANFLNLYASKQAIPIVKAHGLIDHASKVNLKSLMMVSLVHTEITQDPYKEGDPKPKPLEKVVDNCLAFHQLCLLADLQTPKKLDQVTFRMPELYQVPSSGRSKAKKEAKKARKIEQE